MIILLIDPRSKVGAGSEQNIPCGMVLKREPGPLEPDLFPPKLVSEPVEHLTRGRSWFMSTEPETFDLMLTVLQWRLLFSAAAPSLSSAPSAQKWQTAIRGQQ